MSILGTADNDFVFKSLIFAMTILFLLPTAITIYTGLDADLDETTSDLLDDYRDFTGTAPTKEAVWVLTGIYTPYAGQDQYGYTDDGWMYFSRVDRYEPSQFGASKMDYTVARGDDGVYRYTSDTPNGNHKAGDLYSAVSMDVAQKSNVFFTTSGKVESGEFFYYEYSGFRYSFQPRANYDTVNSDGQRIPVIATTTSLSLIWYDYYGSSGISGQLIISGSDSGVAYLTANEIVRAFDSITSTSKFNMTFNGVDMNLYIRLNPYYIAQGLSVEQCYNFGYWEIMVTSLSTDADAYQQPDFKLNPAEIFNTMIKIFTFNGEDLGLSGWTATIAALVISLPFYAIILSIGMSQHAVMILAGVLAAIQAIGSIWPF